MTARVSVRRAVPSDLDGIREIEDASFAHPWAAEAFAEAMTAPAAEVLVAVAGSEVAGHAVIVARGGDAELTNLAVGAVHRGAGIGETLLAAVADEARARRARRVLLAVRASNLAALRLYRRFGFREIGSHKSYYEDPSEDARIMLLKLRHEG